MKKFTDSRVAPGVSIDERLRELVVHLPYAAFGVDHNLSEDKPPNQPWLWFGGASVSCAYDAQAGLLVVEERRMPAHDRGRHKVWLNLPPAYAEQFRRVEILAGGAVACTGLSVDGEMYVEAWNELSLTDVAAAKYFGKSDTSVVTATGLRVVEAEGGENPQAAFYALGGVTIRQSAGQWRFAGAAAFLENAACQVC